MRHTPELTVRLEDDLPKFEGLTVYVLVLVPLPEAFRDMRTAVERH